MKQAEYTSVKDVLDAYNELLPWEKQEFFDKISGEYEDEYCLDGIVDYCTDEILDKLLFKKWYFSNDWRIRKCW